MNKSRVALGELGFVLLGILVFFICLYSNADAFQGSGSAITAAAPAAPQDPQLPLPGLPPAKLDGHWWSGLGVGILGGIQAVFVGMMKNRDKDTGKLPKLDYKLCLKTLAVGVVVGMAAHFLKWSPSDAAAWMVTAPIGGVVTAGVEDLVDLVWRKFFPPPPPDPLKS